MILFLINLMRGCHGCDHMVAGISTTCAISSCEFKHRSWQSGYIYDTTLCDKFCQ